MVQTEEEVFKSAQALFDQKVYQKLRNYIWSNHGLCETDAVKLKLLHLWEESLYQEFLDNRSTHGASANNSTNNNNETSNSKTLLSSSMRYKLRKKNPCPIELENELRVKNARLPKPVHDGLNSWLKKHQENPYPNKAEKEALSAKLGITPQQVNRWFIQRRKMLRIRGKLYLGRGITDTGSDDNEEDEDDDESESIMNQHQSQHNVLLLVPNDVSQGKVDGQSPLLEKILTQQQQYINKSLSSGGSVEVLDRQDDAFPLTPPPSISGDSNARSTPPETALSQGYTNTEWTHGDQALDLSTKMSPVILEPLSPHWKQGEEPEQSEPQDMTMGTAERIAVNALLALSKAH